MINPNLKSHCVRSWVAGVGAVALAVSAAQASVTWKDIQFGGFASQGYLHSSANDYLGETSEGTFDFREYAVNASWAQGAWRVGAQAFGQKLGQYGDDRIKLDWATVDYQPRQWLGFRAGRVKTPRGLYNEALDLDAVRPFVLLPQSVYDARLRDFNASFDGAMIYGNVPAGTIGSVDYRIYYGTTDMSVDSGANDYFNNDVPYPNVRIGLDGIRGGTLFWNTPKTGLRLGYSYTGFEKLSSDRRIVIPAMPPFMPEPFDFVLYKSTRLYERQLLSAEYVVGDWVFAAEGGRERARYDIGFPGQAPTAEIWFEGVYGYVSAARRINAWLELGTYYSYSIDQTNQAVAFVTIPDLIQDDFAVSARFDVNDHVIVKLEVHQYRGAGKLFDTPQQPQPVAQRDTSWTMVAAKVTLSF